MTERLQLRFHPKPGEWYQFVHRNTHKGTFYARFVSEYKDKADLADPVMLEVEVWTGPGSGQERLANAVSHANGVKQSPMFSPKRLRLSQLVAVNPLSNEEQKRFQGMSLEPARSPEYAAPPAAKPEEARKEEPKRRFGIFRRKN